MRKISVLVSLFLFIIIFNSCRGFQKLLKSNDYEHKYTMAVQYYEEEKYNKAMQLFEQLIPIYKGMEKGEEVLYRYAQCNYKSRDYILGGYFFRRFTQTYPNSEYAEECQFLSAYCYYLDSPKPSLDQETTNQALLEFELFLTKYPNTPLKDTCNILVDKLRYKLQKKSFDNAKLYYDLGLYNAATISLQNSFKDYPDSPLKAETLYYIIKSKYDYAINSIRNKQRERFESTLKDIKKFKEDHSKSKYIRDVQRMHDNIQKRLLKLK